MTYRLVADGTTLRLDRPRASVVADLLSEDQFEAVRRGDLIVLSDGALTDLEGPLSGSGTYELRNPDPAVDFAMFEVPINDALEYVAPAELMRIRQWQREAGVADVRKLSLADIRLRMSPAPRPFFSDRTLRSTAHDALLASLGRQPRSVPLSGLRAAS